MSLAAAAERGRLPRLVLGPRRLLELCHRRHMGSSVSLPAAQHA